MIISYYIIVLVLSITFVNCDEKIESIGIYYYSPFKRSEIQISPLSEIPTFNTKLPLKVVIHGWMGERNHITIDPIKNAYLSRGTVNLIIADWSQGASQNYDLSRNFVANAALRIAQQLELFMRKMKIDQYDTVHILGHSLGSHIAGNIGKYFNGTIGRVTGLDPAGPLFNLTSEDALMKTDAKFVDSIHTCVGILGELIPRAHVDFYPNRGLPPQPGCLLPDILTFSACSHYRAPLLYAESILLPKQFLAAECNRESLFKSIKYCKPKYNLNSERMTTYMGENVSKNSSGIFYLETNNSPPYGKGNYYV